MDQASNRDPTFAQGADGFGRRFGADFAGQTTWRFFTDFAYPTIFSENPRYYRLIHGSGRQHFFHAIEHTFVAQHDSGKYMFNYSQWFGTATAVGLNDVYHPGNERGLTPALRVNGYALATAWVSTSSGNFGQTSLTSSTCRSTIRVSGWQRTLEALLVEILATNSGASLVSEHITSEPSERL